MVLRKLLSAVLVLASVSVVLAQGNAPGSWWPVHTKRAWRYDATFTANGETKSISYEVRAKEKETLAGRDVYALVTSQKARTLATEWYGFEGTQVLLIKQASGSDTPRVLDPPQVFLDTSKFVEGGTWEWKSQDGGETVTSRFLGNEKIKLKDGRERECAVVETTVRFQAKTGETKGAHEQKRKLWLERGVGLVREVSTTTSQGQDGAAVETATEVMLAGQE